MRRLTAIYALLCFALILAAGFPASEAAYRPYGISVAGSDSNNSTTSPADATGITFEALANSTYEVEISGVVVAAASTTGCQPLLTGPSGTVLHGTWFYGADASNDRYLFIYGTIDVAAAFTASRTASGGLGETPIAYHGTVVTGGSAGTVKMRFQSEVAASQVSVKAGTFITWRRLGA